MTDSPADLNSNKDHHALQKKIDELQHRLDTYIERDRLIPNFEDQFRDVIEYAPTIIYYCRNSPRYEMIYLNKAVTKLTGYEKDAFLDARIAFAELMHADDRDRVSNVIQQAIMDNHEYHVTYRIQHRDGTWIWVQEIGQGVYDENTGQTAYLKGCLWDITAGKIHEEQLEARDSILEAVHFAVEQFLRTGDWESRIKDVLDRIGNATGVSYVFIFQNHTATSQDVAKNVQPISSVSSLKYDIEVGDQLYSQVHQWYSELIPPGKNRIQSRSIPYDKAGLSRWRKLLASGESICQNVASLPDSERLYLQGRGLSSINIVPIFAGGEWWGFIAIDEGSRERKWSDREMSLLRSVADTIGASIVRQRYEVKLRELNEQLEQRVMERTAQLERLNEKFEHQAHTLQTIFAASPDHLWLFDPMNRIMKASKSVFDAYGVNEDFLYGKTPYEAGFTKQRMHGVIDKIRKMFESGVSQGGEVVMDTIDGPRTFSYTVAPLRDANGYIYGGLSVSRDITERIDAENQLKESQQRLQGVLDNTPASIYLKDKDGAYIFVNRLFENRYRRNIIDLVGKTDFDIFPQHIASNYRKNDIDVMNSGRTVEFEEAAVIDGEPRVNLSIKFPVYDAENKVSGICGISADITERKNAEQVWKLVRTAIDQIDEAVTITDARADEPGPEIIYVNPAFERITGWRSANIVGKSPRVLTGPKTDPSVFNEYRQAIKEGRACSGENVCYRRDGKEFMAEWHMTPVRNEKGQVVNFVTIQRDVSEQKHVEEMERRRRDELAHVARLSTMGEMASGLAHELNQPLAAISNYVFGCRKRVEMDRMDKDSLIEALHNVGSQAQRAGEIIRRMRNFVRKRESQKNYISVNEIVTEVVALCAPELRDNSVQVSENLPDDLPMVGVDAIQIEQVIINLVRNSIEAMREVPFKERCLSLSTSTIFDDEEMVLFELSDSGVGLDPEMVKEIFNPFFSTKSDGMGMGLTISQSIVENHGGKLWAVSNDDQPGVTFKMTLPVCDEPEENADDGE